MLKEYWVVHDKNARKKYRVTMLHDGEIVDTFYCKDITEFQLKQLSSLQGYTQIDYIAPQFEPSEEMEADDDE